MNEDVHGSLSSLVARLLQEHGGGEPYFDHLDAELRQVELLHLVQRLLDVRGDVVCSGKFGRYLLDLYRRGEIRIDGSLLVVSGGLRKSETVEVEAVCVTGGAPPSGTYTFVDDSYYSGITAQRVRAFLESHGASIVDIRVIYDGSPVPIPGVTSFYRYYDHHTAQQ